MSIRLLDLEFTPAVNNGWESGLLKFGEKVTVVHGDNTTGKTPLLKGIVFCLGYPATIPQEVKINCKEVKLNVSILGERITFTRQLNIDFNIEIQSKDSRKLFTNANEFSEEIFRLFGFSRPTLTRKLGVGSSQPYVDSLFPLFWIDQDSGWNEIYRPIRSKDFIKSSKQEMIRLMLGIVPKYPFVDKTMYEAAKEKLEATEQAIRVKKELLKQLKISNSFENKEYLEELNTKKNGIKKELDVVSEKMTLFRSSNTVTLEKVSEQDSALKELRKRIEELRVRRNTLLSETNDLDSEISILSDNTVVADAFKDFCGLNHCKVFNREAFGKKLLYLKDQRKDIVTVISALDLEIGQLQSEEKKLEENRAILKSSMTEANGLEGVQILSRQLISDLVSVETQIAKLASDQEVVVQFNNLLIRLREEQENVEALKPKGGGSKRITSLTEALDFMNTTLAGWLNVINYEFKTARIDEVFELYIDGSHFKESSEESGSSRQRVILAFYATLIETCFHLDGNHPGFMVLDGIIQHELSVDDLTNYLNKVIGLEKRYNRSVQLVFSITAEEFDLNLNSGKVIWKPTYPINTKDKQAKLMYLGSRKK